jgi:hypothetical protein
MLSSLPKIFDKNFVVGFLLPALLAIVAVTWSFPGLGVLAPVRSLSESPKLFGDLTYSALITLVLAIFLMTTNDTQYKIFEGYFPPISWFPPLRWWQRFRFRQQLRQYNNIKRDWLAAINGHEEFPDAQKLQYERLRSILIFYYPTYENEVMMTTFGNIIRSFEVYPREIYGVDSVHVWSRLASVISKEFAVIVDDARAQTDCFVNLTTLSILVALASVVTAILSTEWRPIELKSFTIQSAGDLLAHPGPRHAAAAVAGVAVAAIAYWRACVSAMTWGTLVRSAFDCFLPALVRQLGYALPPTMPERKKFWTEFSVLIAFQEPMSPDWPIIAETAQASREVTKPPETGPEDREKKIEQGDMASVGPSEPSATLGQERTDTESMGDTLAAQ